MASLVDKKDLTPEELWTQCNFTSRDSIITLFPTYMKEIHALQKENKKNVSKAVDIESFTLKTPFGDQTLLKSTELKLEANKRQALIGNNNTGKTLMFHNMSSGAIKGFPKHLHVHHCKELENHELSDTVLGTVVNSYPYRNILLKVEAHIKDLLSKDPEPAVKCGLQENLDWVRFSANTIRAYDAEERAAKMLRVLGFDDFGMKKLCSELSGGLRMRVALCVAFFIEADLLLLDEPTNHLDFPSVLWLENRLRGYKGSFLLVSHDRELLNNVCTSVLLIENKEILYYACGFKEFERKKADEDKKKFEEIEKFLMKNRNADPSTMLGKQKQEKKDWSDTYYAKQVALAGKFTFPIATALENKDNLPLDDIVLIDLKDVTFSYNVSTGVYIFQNPINFTVTASTRIGVMGPNGAGKSTLLKLLTHKLTPVTGTVTHHPEYTLAYFGQHSTAELDLEMTPIEFMTKMFPKEQAGSLRSHLAKTSISGTVADTRMHRLSFSQRSCIIFSKLTYFAPHLLILDEPTNFLDLESVDSLISACNKYKGALLLVSHNRDFLKRCAKAYLSVVPGRFELYGDLKSAEKATYTFIADMEEGNTSAAKSALANNPGGGSVHSSQKTDGFEEKKGPVATIENGVKVFSISAAPVAAKKPAAAAAAAPAAVTFTVGEKCTAKWTDGKFYAAVIKKHDPKTDKYTITYTQYGNTAAVAASALKKAAPAPAAAAAGGAAGAKKPAAPGGK